MQGQKKKECICEWFFYYLSALFVYAFLVLMLLLSLFFFPRSNLVSHMQSTFDGVVGNTTRAHRLMLRTYLVHGQTTHLALLRLLFQAFFELARDIGSVDVLAELAVKAILIVQKREERLKKEAEKEGESYDSWQSNASPIPSSEDVQAVSPLTSAPRPFEVSTLSSQLQSEHAIVVEFLQSTTLEAEVRGQSSEAQKKGIAGVPFSVIERKWAVSGCQSPECYFKVCVLVSSLWSLIISYTTCRYLKSWVRWTNQR